jgi:hypothetical protein
VTYFLFHRIQPLNAPGEVGSFHENKLKLGIKVYFLAPSFANLSASSDFIQDMRKTSQGEITKEIVEKSRLELLLHYKTTPLEVREKYTIRSSVTANAQRERQSGNDIATFVLQPILQLPTLMTPNITEKRGLKAAAIKI